MGASLINILGDIDGCLVVGVNVVGRSVVGLDEVG